ncbi:hypothetical protein [Gilvimarinus sp. DA14]|uniref:hypothetical protein n=1 Tax=Gilvimarinus sp. DA14 TaxID=2956798 RepID=UPI0020B82E54|nr:hypothetical protein [Gilvimarinus sp. DA14]UTF59182.1 hypothetical protein NHM04_11920 [Gilvimarinus sp. DA14]
MKTYGVLLAGLLLASGAVADEANSEASDSLILASAQRSENIRFEIDTPANAEAIKVVDLETTAKAEELADKISAKLDAKFEEEMKRQLGL